MTFKIGQRVTLKDKFRVHVTPDVHELLELDYVTVTSVQEGKGTFTYEETTEKGKTTYIAMDAFDPWHPFSKPWDSMDKEEQQLFLKAIIEAMFTDANMVHKIATLINYTKDE